jgi:hypothetical protein
MDSPARVRHGRLSPWDLRANHLGLLAQHSGGAFDDRGKPFLKDRIEADHGGLQAHCQFNEQGIVRGMTGRNRAGDRSSPQERDIDGFDSQGRGASDYGIDVFSGDPLKLDRLPDDVCELGLPVRGCRELPWSVQQAAGLFAALSLAEQGGRDDIGVDDQRYTRPSSIAR